MLHEKLYASWLKHRRRSISATKVIAITFACIIFFGALLLTLPIASRSGERCDFLSALFTATSATCVTGLVLFDTWTQWSAFGQVVIISLIEIGGLGFMSAASLAFFLLRKKIGLRQRLVMAQALSVNDLESVVHIQRVVIFGSLGVQAIGAVILTVHFLPTYGVKQSLCWGVFHAISAFCNAGFDIFGSINPGVSLYEFRSDPVVLLTLGALVTVGGLGFLVWQEIATVHSWRGFSVYTKLVLLMTTVLIVAGTGIICLLEWDNPETLGALSVPDKLLNGLFQAVTLRTAGFVSFDQTGLTDAGKAFSMVLMLIGGSSGSTAGGAKTVTVLVLILFLCARARGRETVCVFGRTVAEKQVLDAATIVMLMLGLSVFGGIVVSATSPIGFTDAMYEVVSALATVGLTAGATGKLSVCARILIILYMYFGRVGILTISLGFLSADGARERYRYAQTNLLIG